MKPELRFETKRMRACSLGEESSVPDIAGSAILQNDLEFDLDEEDEIFEAYGTRRNAYPYRQYQAYSRELKERRVKTAVLENDCLRAVFLPEYGGRLWELWDKRRQENLLYTNDVIRFSNLAACNAWFSGGVEWNPGIIGHTPFTVRPLYTARLEEAGIPVLRMYEYERIRGVEYQMDFWLEEKDACLNCRMRIVNSGSQVVPMYWWSNMAVPEYAGGRIVVPAKEAYTSREAKVSKVSIPQVEGVDITRYENIPSQIDYFFHIPEESPKFIANLNQEGYGLLQYSTKRLRGRKLFSWGHKEGADRWQEFLTEDAGRYVEIQAGLGKTQYGCIPMPPHSAWEWLERYGSIQVPPEELRLGFEELSAALAGKVAARIQKEQLEERLRKTRAMARRKGIAVYEGSGFGALEVLRRDLAGERPMSPHLEYHMTGESLENWAMLLKEGRLGQGEDRDRPDEFMCDSCYYERLKCIKEEDLDWHASYQLGVMHLYYGKEEAAREAFLYSFRRKENPWACHGLGVLAMQKEQSAEAADWLEKGIGMRKADLSYVKEGLRLILKTKEYRSVIRICEELPEKTRTESRVVFDYLTALSHEGRCQEVLAYFAAHPDYVLDDLREGEDSISELWSSAYEAVHGRKPDEIPRQWNFYSL